jgi:hypothetical protein
MRAACPALRSYQMQIVFLAMDVNDLRNALPQGEHGRDDRSGARAEDQVKAFVEAAPDHRLDLTQNSESVEPLGPAAVETEYTK